MTELDIPTEQLKRQHSADNATAHGQWTIIHTTGGWMVKTQISIMRIATIKLYQTRKHSITSAQQGRRVV